MGNINEQHIQRCPSGRAAANRYPRYIIHHDRAPPGRLVLHVPGDHPLAAVLGSHRTMMKTFIHAYRRYLTHALALSTLESVMHAIAGLL